MDNSLQKNMFKNLKFILREDSFDRDKRYSELYSKVIQKYFQIDENFISEVKKVLNSRNVLLTSDQNIDDLEYHQCAYLLRFALFDSSLSQQKFYESVSMYEKIVQRLSCKTHINICCLGNHGIFSVIGLCKVIEESVKQLGFQDDSTLVRIFIVDKIPAWKRLIKYVVDIASKEFPSLKLQLNYIEGDLEKNVSTDVETALEKSHLVTSVHHAPVTNEAQIFPKVIKNTLAHTKKNAVLFYLFHSNQKRFLDLKHLIAKDTSFGEVKLSHSKEKYILNKRIKFPHLHQSVSLLDPLRRREIDSVMFSTWINRPDIKVKKEMVKQAADAGSIKTTRAISTEDFYKAKKSSNSLRNSDGRFKLVGKFACVDMEKKNKDDSNRHTAKDVSVSRYANFDNCDMDY